MRKMGIYSAVLLFLGLTAAVVSAKDCLNKSNSKLICYYSKIKDVDSCHCSHVILPANSDVKSIDSLREKLRGVKILLTVHEFNEGLVSIVKNAKIDGLELNLRKLDSKSDISDFISTVRSKLGSDLYVVLSVPPKAELLAKYFDFKALSKSADLFILQTGFLGANKNVTFHPSRLSGLWDMQNADSVVDLVSGLGAPLSKLVLAAPVQAFHFTLQDEKHTAPGSPALDVVTLTRDQLCSKMSANNWTLERDQDQAGPYIFRKNEWIAFDDGVSIDIKAKYSRVRGLAGLALKDITQDGGNKCGGSLLEAAFNGLSKQARAPRGVVLHSLEREILERPARQLENIHLSPYRISRVIDVEGKVHVIRQDTRTEFECSRQGYFVHPRSCGRFYRCVKFDQLTDEYSVFEFDCPAGLAFDSRVEVCVWPGSLPHASACSGSSEIAPVPKQRFVCPGEQGYYADPENCRWFFACLDHGKSHLTAYEFRCPFGLVFDQDHLLCEWPWLVPKCANGATSSIVLGLYQPSVTVHGGHGLADSDFVLEQYNGLGSLGRITLGGVAGPIEQPVAKVYTSFGAHGGGQNIIGNAGHDATLLGASHSGHLSYVDGNVDTATGSVYLPTDGSASVTYHDKTNLAVKGNEDLVLNAGHGATLLGGSQRGHLSHVGGNVGIATGGAYLATNGGASITYHGKTNLAAGGNEGLILNAGRGATLLGGSQRGHLSYVGGNVGTATGDAYATNGGASITYHGKTNLAAGGNEGLILNVGRGATLLGGSQRGHLSYVGGNVDTATGNAYSATDGGGSITYHGKTNLATGGNEGLILNAGHDATILGGSQSGHLDYAGENAGVASSGAYLGTGDDASLTYHGKSNLAVGVNDGFTLNAGAYRGNVKYLSTGDQHGRTGSYSYQNNANEILKSALDQGINGYDVSGNIGAVTLQATGISDLKTSTASRGSTKYQGLVSGSLQSGVNEQIAGYTAGLANSKVNGGYDIAGGVLQSSDISAVNHGTIINDDNLRSTVTYHGNNGIIKSNQLAGKANLNVYDSGLTILDNTEQLNNINKQIISAGINGQVIGHGSLLTTDEQSSVDSSGIKGNYQKQSGPIVDGIVSTVTRGPADFSNIVIHGNTKLDVSHENAAALNTGYVLTDDTADYHGSDHVISQLSSQNIGINQGGITSGIQGVGGEEIVENREVQFGNANGQGVIENHGLQLFQKSGAQISNQNRGVAGNIDIIGGGFSAVKLGSESQSGVQLIQHGANVDTLEHVTPVSVTPSSISTANIPVVTSVPVPAIKTATGFDIYKGGVVANVPELQYKLDSPKSINNAFYQTQIKGNSFSAAGASSFANVSSSLVGYASSTSAPILAVTGGYALTKPTVGFVDGQVDLKLVSPAISTVKQAQRAGGFDYSKSVDAVSFVNQQTEPVVHQQVSVVQPTQSTFLVTHQAPATVLEEHYQPIQPAVVVSQPVQPPVATSHSYHQANHKSQGYIYNRPSIIAEEIPRKPAVISTFSISQPSSIKVQPTQPISVEHVIPVQAVQPEVVSSYNYEESDQGYIYKKPSVVFEEVPQKPAVVSTFSISQPTTPAPVGTIVPIQQPSFSYQQSHRNSQGYVYDRPSVSFEEQPQKPAVISTFSISQPSADKTAIIGEALHHVVPVQPAPISLQGYQHSINHANEYLSNRSTVYFEQRPQTAVLSRGYNYVSPAVVVDQKPILQAEIQKTAVQQIQPVQTGSAYSYQNIQNAAHSQNYDYSKSNIEIDKNAGIAVTVAPITTYTLQQPAEFQRKIEVAPVVVNSYHYQKPSVQKTVDTGYVYPKPSVQFVEEPSPVITNYEKLEPVREEPFVAKKAYVTGYQNAQPNIVESYSLPSTPIYEQSIYSTPKPPVTFASTNRPILNQYVLSTPRPHIPSTRVIEDYYISSTPKPTYASTIASVVSQPVTVKPYTFYSYDSRVVSTPKPIIQSTPIPEIVNFPATQSRPISRYSFSSLDQKYNLASTPASLVESATPVIHESINIAPVLPQSHTQYSLNQKHSLVSTPVLIPKIPETVSVAPVFRPVPQSQPTTRYSFNSLDQKYNFVSTPATLIDDAAPVVAQVVTPAPILPAVAVTQSKPISRYSFSSLDDKYNNYVSNQAAYVDVSPTTAPNVEPVSSYAFGTSQNFIDHFSSAIIPKTLVTDTRRRNYVSTVPTIVTDDEKTIVNVSPNVPIISTTSRPISRYSFSSLDDNYAFTPSTPTNLNAVVDEVIVSTPKTIVETPTLTPAYLPPVRQYVENYDTGNNRFAIKSRRPVKVVKLVRPKSQAIVKVNDFHPLLAAKLGAQCTCVSNTLRLKKKPVRVQIYDDDDVEEYVVKQNNNLDLVNNDYANVLADSDLQQRTESVAVEDYKFEPEKVVEITPIPEVIQSTSVLPDYNVPVVVRKRVKVRPYLYTTTAYNDLPVTKVTDVFLKSTAAPSVQIIDDDGGPDQKDVEDVVRKGLSLIKSAAKQGAKEALTEHMYDRYGPGGVRSRDETLQGAVDCQRAGLFRHPTHCNKFYACRWDCTKNRYTLHIFNCPVHLTFDNNLGACNWPSQGPACLGNTLLPSE